MNGILELFLKLNYQLYERYIFSRIHNGHGNHSSTHNGNHRVNGDKCVGKKPSTTGEKWIYTRGCYTLLLFIVLLLFVGGGGGLPVYGNHFSVVPWVNNMDR